MKINTAQMKRDYALHVAIVRLIESADRTLIALSLRIAAEQYRKDAAGFAAAGVQRSAEGFTAQAERAEALAEVIEL